MRQFLIKVSIFLLFPAIALLVVDVLLPPTLFTFRTWEALKFATILGDSPFYPNTKTSMIAVGELCHHTSKSIPIKEDWITDKLGFRNDEFIEEADILFIGDSFVAGSNLSQDEIISNQVKTASHNQIRVYNMAPSSFSRLDYYLKTGIIKKPKLIIFSIVERDVPSPITPYKDYSYKDIIRNLLKILNINVYADKMVKFSSVKWIRARIDKSKGFGVPAKENSNMFFLEGTSSRHTSDDLNRTAKIIISYKKYCDSLDIDFIFMPMPNKESVYYELVPFEQQPDYLHQLDSLLHDANVSTINTLEIYNHYRTTSNKLLYHLDDTHWNSNATELISKEIVNKINMSPSSGK